MLTFPMTVTGFAPSSCEMQVCFTVADTSRNVIGFHKIGRSGAARATLVVIVLRSSKKVFFTTALRMNGKSSDLAQLISPRRKQRFFICKAEQSMPRKSSYSCLLAHLFYSNAAALTDRNSFTTTKARLLLTKICCSPTPPSGSQAQFLQEILAKFSKCGVRRYPQKLV